MIGGLDHATAGDLLDRLAAAILDFDGEAVVDLCTPDADVWLDPFGSPLVGPLDLRRGLLDAAAIGEQVELTIERHWVVAPTILAAWHAGYVHRQTRARVRFAGFLTLEIADDGRIRKARTWAVRRESAA